MIFFYLICDCLLVISSNLGPIFHRFRYSTTYILKFSIQNCVQTAADGAWLLLTVYKKSPAPYLMVPSPTPYDLSLSHNTARLAYNSAL